MSEFLVVFLFCLGLAAGLIVLTISIAFCFLGLMFVWGAVMSPEPTPSPTIINIDTDGSILMPGNDASRHFLNQKPSNK